MGGIPSVEIPAILPNTVVKIIVVKIGCMKNQRGPNIVCLYIEIKSLFTNKNNKSLNFQISLMLTSKRFFLGLISEIWFILFTFNSCKTKV